MATSNPARALTLIALTAMSAATAAQGPQDRTQDRVPFPAHTIIRNVHYVGTVTLNSYLVTTPQGHVLINSNYEDTLPLMRASVEKLGFAMTDIEIILGSHAHTDHMQGDALLKEMTGGATVNPYVDPAGYKAWVDNMERSYNSTLAEQEKNPPAN